MTSPENLSAGEALERASRAVREQERLWTHLNPLTNFLRRELNENHFRDRIASVYQTPRG